MVGISHKMILILDKMMERDYKFYLAFENSICRVI